MVKKKSNHQAYWIIGIVVAFIIILPYINLNQKFAISDSDYTCDSPLILNISEESNFNINNGTIYYSNLNTTQVFLSGYNYWTIDNDTSVSYNSFPNLEGTHKIYKISYTIKENDTQIEFNKCYIFYTKEIEKQTVINNSVTYIPANITSSQICNGLGGNYTNLTCSCPNGNKWFDNSTSKVCGPVINTVTNNVNIPPTFFDKYGIAMIIVIISLVIIYFIWRYK